MATNRKTTSKTGASAGGPAGAPAGKAAGKPGPARRGAAKPADVDRRWALLLFGLGLLFLIWTIIPGENVWAFVRENILFGTFGVAGWLLGPMLIWWAVLVSLEKPFFSAIIKGVLFLFALCGLVLVFSPVDFEGLGFGEVLAALHENGRSAPVGGGLLSLLFGASLLALFGSVAARVLCVLLLIVAVMVLTGVTPGDIARFFGRLGDRIAERMDAEAEAGEAYDEPPPNEAPPWHGEPPAQNAPMRPAPPPRSVPVHTPPLQPGKARVAVVDIPLGGESPQAGGQKRRSPLDIDLGPGGPVSQPGPSPSEPVEIGPGGTFGQRALNEPQGGELGLPGDFEPLVPFNPASRERLPEGAGRLLLFGEDDPYANLGGAQSRLPRGTLLDVEYVPRPGQDFDLFNEAEGRSAAAPEDGHPAVPRPAVRPTLPDAPEFFADSAAGVGGTAAPPANGGPPLVNTTPPSGAVPAPINNAESSNTQAPFEGGTPTPGADKPDGANKPGSADELDDLIERAAPKNTEKPGDKGADTRQQAPDAPAPYNYPPATLFDAAPPEATAGVREEMRKTADLLVGTLSSFGVETRILDITRGPSVTRYEVQPQAGVKISRITGLSDDIALNLAAAGVRIEAPIPGKPAVGIEVPNKVKSTVSIRDLLESTAFTASASPLSIALGKDIAGDVVVADLTRMPHLLIAGSTGSGKSVCVNSVIMSFLYKSAPEDVRLILIDPKVVELAEYNGIPHLLIPVVTEPKMAAKALGQAVVEMEDRYHLFAASGVRDINSYNKLARRGGGLEHMPHIAIVIDELADLMMTAGKDVENYICRIAQKARAAGMHLIVATQRPSVDVITGLIKSNIPSRIAFAVSSQVDSRTILDGAGAEKLLGMGDMLFMPIGANKPVRVQGTYVKDREISKVLSFVKSDGLALYDDEFLAEMDKVQLSGAAGKAADDEEELGGDIVRDAVFQSAVETVLEAGQASTSYLQRRLRLGYARAGRIMDQMERLGIISEPDGSKPRQVLITRQGWQEMLMNAAE